MLSGIDLAAIDPQKRKLMSGLFGQHGAESIVLAARPGHVLWTDDGILGGYGAHEFGVRRVWTQALLQWMAHTGALEVEQFFTSTARLFAWGYQFTSMSVNALARAGVLAEWAPNRWPLSQCLELFRYENVDLSALINIAGRFLPELYRTCAMPETRNVVVVKLLDTLASHTGGAAAVQVIYGLLPTLFGVNVLGALEAKAVFDAWFRTRDSELSIKR